jgi:hypothetical protein
MLVPEVFVNNAVAFGAMNDQFSRAKSNRAKNIIPFCSNLINFITSLNNIL